MNVYSRNGSKIEAEKKLELKCYHTEEEKDGKYS